MAIVQFYGVVRDGRIELTRPIDVPDGTPVTITTAELAADLPEDFPAIGMWADREDMVDSVEYLRQRRAERRHRRLYSHLAERGEKPGLFGPTSEPE